MNEKKLLPSPHFRADPTRAKILKAARKLFVESGFAGTSIGKIAEKAKINHSLIFHHFGNKEGLWKAVKQNIVDESKKHSPILPEVDQPFSSFLKKLIIQKIEFYRSNPDIVRMISWQRLEYKSRKDIGLSLSSEAKLWLNALQHYQNKGDINPQFKLEFALTLILAIISSAAMDPNIFIKKDDDLDAYIQFVIERLLITLKEKN